MTPGSRETRRAALVRDLGDRLIDLAALGYDPRWARARVGAAHPLEQRHRLDSEVGGHLLDGHTRAAGPRDPHDILTELLRMRLGHRASQFRCHPIVHQTQVIDPEGDPLEAIPAEECQRVWNR
jgi:hypothetical protein